MGLRTPLPRDGRAPGQAENLLCCDHDRPPHRARPSSEGAYPRTPDGRYFVVRGRLRQLSNPALPEEERAALVAELMAARRAVRAAGDDAAATAVCQAAGGRRQGRARRARAGLVGRRRAGL